MTRREAAIVTCYTGRVIGCISDICRYLEEISGEPVWTHEIPRYLEQYKDRIQLDFISIEITEEDP